MSKTKRIIRIILILATIAALTLGAVGTFSSAAGSDVRGMISIGERYLTEERYDEAVELFSKVIDVEPQSASAYVNRGKAYAALNETDKAMEDYTTAIELDPTLADELRPEIDAWKQAEEEKEQDNLKAILSKNTTKPIQKFYFGDFDADGKYEAFAIAGNKDTSLSDAATDDREFYGLVDIFFVSDSGATLLKSNTYGFVMKNATGQQGGNITVDSYSFFAFEQSAGGSGSLSYVWGVKNQKAMEMNVSGKVEMFSQDKDSGKITGCHGSFSAGYHQYMYYKYIFDEASFTFTQSDLDHIE